MTVALRDQRSPTSSPKLEIVATAGLVEQLRLDQGQRRNCRDPRGGLACREGVRRAAGDAAARADRERSGRRAGTSDAAVRRQRDELPVDCRRGPAGGVAPCPADRQDESARVTFAGRLGGRRAALQERLDAGLVTGRISPKLERVYGVVLDAQSQAIAAIRPGAPAHEVDAVAREVIAEAGFGRYFGHGLGHGIGLDIHEAPRLAAKKTTV